MSTPTAVHSPSPRTAGLGQGARSGKGVFGLAFFAYFLLATAWSFATPLYGAPDEAAHLTRAASVVRGQIYVEPVEAAMGGGGFVRIPESLSLYADGSLPCFGGRPQWSAECFRTLPSSDGIVEVPSLAARYNPVYYALVGLPLLLEPHEAGVYATRILSGVLCCGLLALATAIAFRYGRGWLPLAVAAASTPMLLFLTGTINPNSLEISATLVVWVALGLVLTRDLGPAAERRLLDATTVSSVLMLLTRGLSPLWLLITAGLLLVAASPDRLRVLIRARAVWVRAAIVTAAALAGAAWTVLSQSTGGSTTFNATLTEREAFLRVTLLMPWRLVQMLGYFGHLDTPPPFVMVMVWTLLVGALPVAALMAGRVRTALALAAALLVVLVVPIMLEVPTAPRLGIYWQGRYILPVAVGIPVLAALALEHRWPLVLRPRMLVVWYAAASVAHGAAVYQSMRRWQLGSNGGYNLFAGDWQPPVGTVAVILLTLAAGALATLAPLLPALSSLRRRRTGGRVRVPAAVAGAPAE